MSDIRAWLDLHGFGKYATAFVDNEIEVGDLAYLDEADLETLGLAMGPRKRLLAAVAACDRAVTAEPDPDPSQAEAPRTAAAERRQLTVMFCDLVGSVELGQRLDLEDYRDLLARVRGAAVSAVERFEGFVARHQGDGILAYFGYPAAREDDAERAVHAGLAVISALQRLDGEHTADARPRMRVGIATGAAIVGDVLATGSSTRSELAALGTTPNLAARLQAEALPDQVVVSDTTRELCRSSFEFDSGVRQVRGIQAPIAVHCVLRATGRRSRLDITSGRTLTPLVGREAELALLDRRWQQARGGEGQIVLVSAEPGVGKTRMLMEMHRRLGESGEQLEVWFCSPYHTTSTLHPVIDYLNRKLGSGDALEGRLPALEGWLAELGVDRAGAVPLLAPLLGLEVDGAYQSVALEASEQRRRTLALVAELLLAQAERGALLLAVEDLHWVDPTTEALLVILGEAIRNRPVLALLTFRPEYAPTLGSQPHLTTLTLNHLTGSECVSLVNGLPAGSNLQPEVVRKIVERADGVPLFLEELARSVIEAGAERQQQVPATLRDALTSRLDRLGESKRVAQLAAVIGRVFPWPLLSAASPVAPDSLRTGLDQLVASGLAYRRTLSGDDDYAFKHALVRDCAYQSLLRDECQSLHRRVAAALEEGSSDGAVPELVARHWSDGAEPGRALPLWRRAGEDAQRRGAFTEALGHFEAASACLDGASATAQARMEVALARAECLHFLARRSEALEVLEPHSDAVVSSGEAGFAGRFFVSLGRIQAFGGLRQDALPSFDKAIDYARASGDSPTTGIAYAWIARDQMLTGAPTASRDSFSRAIELLEHSGPSWDLGEAYFRYGMLMTLELADYPYTHHLADQLMALADQLDDPRLRCNAIVLRGHALTMTGDWERAEDTLRQLLRESPNQYEYAFAVGFLAELHLERGDPETALPFIEQQREMSGYRSREVGCLGINRLARALLQQGRHDEARAIALEALAVADELGYWRGRFEANRVLARVARHVGDLQAAREHLDIVATLVAGSSNPTAEAELQSELAELRYHTGDREGAINLLAQALTGYERLDMAGRAGKIRELLGAWGAT